MIKITVFNSVSSIKFIALLMAVLTTNGCSNLKSTLGLKAKGPDEFTVISYPSLSVPPILNYDGSVGSNLEQQGNISKNNLNANPNSNINLEDKDFLDKIN